MMAINIGAGAPVVFKDGRSSGRGTNRRLIRITPLRLQ
jgi:hypothetical protein